MELTNRDFTRLKTFMYNNYGINLENKKKLIETRLALVVKRLRFNDFSSYIDALMKDKTGEYVAIVVEKLTTNFTYFMREEQHFNFLKNNIIIPKIKKNMPSSVNIWCAASSTGEEPYCLAMTSKSALGINKKVNISITASDISMNVLKIAKNGVYSPEKVSKLPSDWVKNYFKQTTNRNYEVIDDIKKMISFKYFNLNGITGWEKNKYDVIFCRNVMIYFDEPTKKKLCTKLSEALKPGGYLIIGLSENLSSQITEFQRVEPSVYKKK